MRAYRGRRILRYTVVMAVALLWTTDVFCLEQAGPPEPSAAAVSAADPDDWSLDDVHDVCEATYFVAITIGIGVALWWFFVRYLPRERSPRLRFEVDVRRVGTQGGSALIEVVAEVENVGSVPIYWISFRFALAAVAAADEPEKTRQLSTSNGMTPLIDGSWADATNGVDAGVCRQFACLLAIPTTVACVAVTASLAVTGEHRSRTATTIKQIA